MVFRGDGRGDGYLYFNPSSEKLILIPNTRFRSYLFIKDSDYLVQG